MRAFRLFILAWALAGLTWAAQAPLAAAEALPVSELDQALQDQGWPPEATSRLLALAYDADGNLQTQCQCGGAPDGPCVHALAALFAYSQRGGGTADLRGALEGAIEERILRGRTEVQVEPISGGDRGSDRGRRGHAESAFLGTCRVRNCA